MNEICNDNREILITKYYEKLIEETNIETSYDEMQVLKNILFRMWQLGWLDRLENAVSVVRCKDCKHWKIGKDPDETEYRLCDEFFAILGADNYCSRGERI